MPADILGYSCRVMPIDAVIKQWRQLFPDSPAPAPYATGMLPGPSPFE